jgi:GNAT superfamily N-acetyltransferase
VWSISCLFVAKEFRRRGVSVKLIKAAIDYVRAKGGLIVESYPVQPRNPVMPDVFAQTGLVSAFLQAGFREVARRAETRPIMRFDVLSKSTTQQLDG